MHGVYVWYLACMRIYHDLCYLQITELVFCRYFNYPVIPIILSDQKGLSTPSDQKGYVPCQTKRVMYPVRPEGLITLWDQKSQLSCQTRKVNYPVRPKGLLTLLHHNDRIQSYKNGELPCQTKGVNYFVILRQAIMHVYNTCICYTWNAHVFRHMWYT